MMISNEGTCIIPKIMLIPLQGGPTIMPDFSLLMLHLILISLMVLLTNVEVARWRDGPAEEVIAGVTFEKSYGHQLQRLHGLKLINV